MLYLPISLFIFIFLPLHNFVNFPPQCFYSLFAILIFHHPLLILFYPSPSQFLLFSLLHLHLLIYSIYIFHPQIHRPPINPTSTPHRPYIDLLSTLHRPYIDPTSTLHRPHVDPTSTQHRLNIEPRLNFFFNTAW